MKPDGGEWIEDGVSREIEFVEGVRGEHACAVDRRPARRVLFVHRHVEATPGEQARDVKAARPATDNGHVSHAVVFLERSAEGPKLSRPKDTRE